LSRGRNWGEGVWSPPCRVPGPPAPRAKWRTHWPAGLCAPRPLAGLREEHEATVAGRQSEGGGQADGRRAARAARRGHGGCGAADGRSALAAVRRPRWATSRVVLILLSWLRPAGSRRPLPWRPALHARPGPCPCPRPHRRRGAQCAPVGSLPGHAETGARWVSLGGPSAGEASPVRRRTVRGATPEPSRAPLRRKRLVGLARASEPEARDAFWKRFQRVVPAPGEVCARSRSAGAWSTWSSLRRVLPSQVLPAGGSGGNAPYPLFSAGPCSGTAVDKAREQCSRDRLLGSA
jgi:hypothetical protein